jgi:hypothetical protein
VTAALDSQASASDLKVGVSLLGHVTIPAGSRGVAAAHKPERAKSLNQPGSLGGAPAKLGTRRMFPAALHYERLTYAG